MAHFPWRLCAFVPLVAAAVVWAAARLGAKAMSVCAVAAQAITVALGTAMLACVVGGAECVDDVGTWLAAGDLLVRLVFVVDGATALAAAVVIVSGGHTVWVLRQGAQALPWLLAAEAFAVTTALADDLGMAAAAWAAASLCCDAGSRVQPSVDGDAAAVSHVVWHRVADALALVGFAAVIAQAPASSYSDLAHASAQGDLTARVPLFAFVAALGARACALSLRRVNGGLACAVLIAAGYALVYRVARASGADVSHWLVFSAAVAAAAWVAARPHPADNERRPRHLAALASVATWCGRGVYALAAWVPDALLLQGPAVIADACARLLRLFHGGDAQRHVGVGLLGVAALTFVATRPASSPTLDLHVDGLTVRVDAGRGESSQRLEFDYDFDGDGALDRAAAGPFASFTYATSGAYAVVVTVRDPLWHTRRTLRATVEVGQR